MTEFSIQPNSVCFVDTNIWLYAFIKSQDEEKTAVSKTIIENCEIVLSTQVVNEMCVNLIKKAGFSEKQIQELIKSFYKRNLIIELSQDILLSSSKIRSQHNFSFWDSLIAACALECGANYLISEDMQNGFVLNKRMTIINPFK